MTLTEYQPFRALYGTGATLGILATLPWYTIKYILPAARPVKSWTLKQAVLQPLIRSSLQLQADLRFRTPWSLDPGKLGDRFEVIQPASAEYYTGVLTNENIKPVPIPGVWYPDSSSRISSEQPVILHIHGGSFVLQDCRPLDCEFPAKVMQCISPRIFMSGYRLASNPGGTFPAALQDVLTAYIFIQSLAGSGRNIILSGDSAGANLALGLLRYIYSQEGEALGLQRPKAALLWSPWLDIAKVHNNPGVIDSHPNATIDFVNSRIVGWGARALGDAEDVLSPYVTSIDHPFAASDTLLWYQTSDAEILHEDASRSYEQMRSIPNNIAELHIEAGVTHDILTAGWISAFQKNAFESAAKAKEFLDSASANALST